MKLTGAVPQNALDILIEDAKQLIKGWGGQEPDFLLLNSKLTFQMTMLPEKTQYLTQGYDGVKRLQNGPTISTYRGLKIIKSKQFSMEQGSAPRDLLRRRVRVAEYYHVPCCYTGGWKLASHGGEPYAPGEQAASEMSTVGGQRGVDMFSGAVDPSAAAGIATAATAADGTVVVRHKEDALGELMLYDESSDSWTSIGYDKLLEQGRKFGAYANQFLPRRPNGDPLKSPVEQDFGSVLVTDLGRMRARHGFRAGPAHTLAHFAGPASQHRALDVGRVCWQGRHRLLGRYAVGADRVERFR